MEKLGLTTRADLVRFALECGILAPASPRSNARRAMADCRSLLQTTGTIAPWSQGVTMKTRVSGRKGSAFLRGTLLAAFAVTACLIFADQPVARAAWAPSLPHLRRAPPPHRRR